MKLSDTSISRPVFATVMSLVIILIGVVSYSRLAVREYPKIDEPSVTVTTTFPGASAEIMETQVTKPIEDSLSGIEGIKVMSSVSREGTSAVSINFVETRDPDDAASDVRDRVSRARDMLPEQVDEPIIAKVEADAQPIIWMVMRSQKYNPTQLTDYADRYIQDMLQTVPGVAEAMIFGQRRYAMRIWLDPIKLASHNVTVQEVEDALRAQNLDAPSGKIEGKQREFTVLTISDLQTVDQFNNIIIRSNMEGTVRLSDIGRAALGVENDRVSFRYNSKDAVALGIVKQSTANPVEISKDINKLLPRIRASLPQEIEIDIGYDSSVFISKSISNVYKTIGEATLLVVIVIFLFLGTFRATLIPLVTIPVSLIGAFAIMWWLGFSINTLTMLAMVLAIGLVVDDAIVMLENIYRHIEEGMSPHKAALKGSSEIAFAVIAMTLTLAAVYVPVSFIEGRTGKLFIEFALTLAGAVIISGFVAITLSPMMCSIILKKHKERKGFHNRIERFLTSVENSYKRTVTRVLSVRMIVIPVVLGIGVGCFFLFTTLKSELAPTEDRGIVFMVFQGPEGATVDYMSAYSRQLEKIISEVPEVIRYGVVSGIGAGRLPTATNGLGFIGVKSWADRKRSTTDVAGSIAPQLFSVPGVMAFAIAPASLGAGGFSKPVDFVIKDSRSYEDIGADVNKLLLEIAKNPNIQGVESDLKINTPQIKVHINRDKLQAAGINVSDLTRALETLLASRKVNRFKRNGEQYDVIMEVEEHLRSEPEQLNQIYLRTKTQEFVPISNFVSLEQTVAPRDLNHFNRMRAVKITANVAPTYSLGEALKYMEETARNVVGKTAIFDYDGQSREFMESSSSLYFAMALAILFIYLVLAAQFESFIDPIIILITVPLTMFGALGALHLTGNTLNIYSQIGLITLIGLITKHGILIVEFANKQQELGKTKFEAVTEAASLRLRPIMMTTAAMVIGAVPLAYATEAGAESRRVLGWVIVGGMMVGTFLTLFVLPAVYTFLAGTHKHEEEDEAPGTEVKA